MDDRYLPEKYSRVMISRVLVVCFAMHRPSVVLAEDSLTRFMDEFVGILPKIGYLHNQRNVFNRFWNLAEL